MSAGPGTRSSAVAQDRFSGSAQPEREQQLAASSPLAVRAVAGRHPATVAKVRGCVPTGVGRGVTKRGQVMVTHEVAKQQTFAVGAAVAQPVRLGLAGAVGGEMLAPVRSGAVAAGSLDDAPPAARVSAPGVAPLGAVAEQSALDRPPGAARPGGGGVGAPGHDHGASPRRSGAAGRPDRVRFGVAVIAAKTRHHMQLRRTQTFAAVR